MSETKAKCQISVPNEQCQRNQTHEQASHESLSQETQNTQEILDDLLNDDVCDHPNKQLDSKSLQPSIDKMGHLKKRSRSQKIQLAKKNVDPLKKQPNHDKLQQTTNDLLEDFKQLSEAEQIFYGFKSKEENITISNAVFSSKKNNPFSVDRKNHFKKQLKHLTKRKKKKNIVTLATKLIKKRVKLTKSKRKKVQQARVKLKAHQRRKQTDVE